MYPGHTPRIDGFAGVPIGAIYAAQQQPAYYPKLPYSPPVDPAEIAARQSTIEEITALSDPRTRLVRALVHDYTVVRDADESQRVSYKVKKYWRPAERDVDPALKVPADLWARMYKSYENYAHPLTEHETQAFGRWFVGEAVARSVPADSTIPWPVQPQRSIFGKIKTIDAWPGEAVYAVGSPVAVWRVPQRIHGGYLWVNALRSDVLIAANGVVHIPGVVKDRAVVTDWNFDVITLIWLGSRLGMPVNPATAGVFRKI